MFLSIFRFFLVTWIPDSAHKNRDFTHTECLSLELSLLINHKVPRKQRDLLQSLMHHFLLAPNKSLNHP